MDESGGGDRPGVDHRVEWATGARLQADGVEGLAGRFHPDFLKNLDLAMIFQSDSVVEGLGDRLDREFLSGVACLVTAPSAVTRQMPNQFGSALPSSGI